MRAFYLHRLDNTEVIRARAVWTAWAIRAEDNAAAATAERHGPGDPVALWPPQRMPEITAWHQLTGSLGFTPPSRATGPPESPATPFIRPEPIPRIGSEPRF